MFRNSVVPLHIVVRSRMLFQKVNCQEKDCCTTYEEKKSRNCTDIAALLNGGKVSATPTA